jgi:hypothetical protein
VPVDPPLAVFTRQNAPGLEFGLPNS